MKFENLKTETEASHFCNVSNACIYTEIAIQKVSCTVFTDYFSDMGFLLIQWQLFGCSLKIPTLGHLSVSV